jgi:NADH dehydrogenase (ubiquinone) 1 alpha subcomplex subunit 2
MNQVKNLAVKNVKELRFILCQSSPSSIGVRNWLNKNFVDVKKNNPESLLLIRECENAEPNILARFKYGVERKIACEFATEEEVEEIVTKLVTESDKINSYVNSNKNSKI